MAIKGQDCDRNMISGMEKLKLNIHGAIRIELDRIAFSLDTRYYFHSILLCFRTSLSQCQDLETEIAGLVEVETGTETEMAAADLEAAADSGVGADLEVSVKFLVFYRCCFGFATVSKLHSLSRRGQLEGQAARRQPEGRQLGQGQTGALREELLQRHQGEPERGPPRCREVQVGKGAIYSSVHI